MSETPAPLRAIDLFCGAGGLSQGLKWANFEIPFALDRDEDSCATYRRNHPDTHVECRSISDMSSEEIATLSGGSIDVIVGGPSCQSFSTAGRKNGWVKKGDPRNELWRQMLDVVKTLEPKAFLLENVPGLVYWKKGEFGATILKEFDRLGYTVSNDILLAADYGIPQRRRRVFIVGLKGDKKFEFPKPTHLGGWRRDTLDIWEAKRKEQQLLPHIKLWEAIGDLPSVAGSKPKKSSKPDPGRATPYTRRMRGRRTSPVADHDAIPIGVDHLELIRHVPPGGTWRDIPPHLLPDRYRGMRRTDSTNLFGRLAPDLPAYTITTQFHNVTTGCYTHPYEDRALTVREAARIQSFPDSYVFEGNIQSRCRQVGNAVPPLLAQVLVTSIAEAIMGEEAAKVHPAPRPTRPAKELPSAPKHNVNTKRRLAAQKQTSAMPQVQIRKLLREQGLACKAKKSPVSDIECKPDLVLEEHQIAIYMRGCFINGCPTHARDTKSKTKWWAEAIATAQKQNRRDKRVLRDAGWSVIEVWEHEEPAKAAQRIVAHARRLGVGTTKAKAA
ncbi:MAG: DNA (cytosine-5-)-methyltransferase [Solirubrobacterales bacterium]